MTLIDYKQLWGIQEPILAMAVVIDAVFNLSVIKNYWEKSSNSLQEAQKKIIWPKPVDLSKKFYNIFKVIYGKERLSLRRLITSALSSIFFVVIIYYSLATFFNFGTVEAHFQLGWFSSIFFSSSINTNTFEYLLMLIYCSIIINIIPDMISLAETEWILKKAIKNDVNLFWLFILDIFLTTLIFVVWNIMLMKFDPVISKWTETSSILSLYSFQRSTPLYESFAISTYSTSFFWISSVVVILLIGISKQMSRIILLFIKIPLFSKSVSLITGLFCLFSWPLLFILRMVFA